MISLFRTQAKDLVRVLRSIDLKLGMEPAGKSIYRAAVGVVTGIGDELIVERDFRRVRDGIAVISLDDLFETVIRQCAVADQDCPIHQRQNRLGGWERDR